ncbi:MAG: ATP synthase F0 subunit A [Bacteroidetes bacterium RIFCSPLOWO2_12_FULL_31_6]|nr:MAG: ATP synthase F0 subunit A [Bacteroidetes bacterium RIFCSPLOWO2_12_FULL_31_6]
MKIILSAIIIVFLSVSTFANEDILFNIKSNEKYNPVPPIMEHISDAHSWHIYGGGHDAVALPLPVILWTANGLVTFMSSEFHHDVSGRYIVTKKGLNFVNRHEKIYQLDNEINRLYFDEKGKVTNERPIDISITKNIFAMLISMIILCFVFLKAAKSYQGEVKAPKGIASFMEPLILFVKNDIALQNIGEKHHQRFVPFLLTAFFFIWFNNLLGLIPLPGLSGANITGNIAFTLVLSTITLLLTNLNGNKQYWKHVFWMPGAPVPIKIFLIPIELIGLIAKPFALMIRLFANMTAGHIVVLSLVSLIFIFKSVYMSAVAVPFTLFISVLELLVALLQAYVFTMLSALFIGSAVAEHH